jgi:putative ABC transport system permease protein
MLKNFFKVAIRNLVRQKAYSLLNLLGLSLGIACTLLLTLHIKEELSYDKNFPRHDRIYRVVSTEWSKSSPPLAGEMMKFFPEIGSIARFAGNGMNVFHTTDAKTGEATGYFADSSAMEVFDLQTVLGDPFHALSEPSAIVITRSMANRFFGDKDPIGQKLVANDKEDCWVRAVIEDLPSNTHLKFDFLRPMPLLYRLAGPKWMSNRGWMFGWTYIQLRRPEDITKVQGRLKSFWSDYRSDFSDKAVNAADAANARLQPLTDIHLHSNLIQEMGPNSSIIYIYIFIAVGTLILLIACINFVNLFTTQSLKRLKEVAVRKVLGAPRLQLVLQFLGEALILAALSGLIAIALYQLALPFYNSLTGRQVPASILLQPVNILIIAGIILVTGLLSGLFPALFIAGFKPAASLKGNKTSGSPAGILRKSLVVFQFVASGFLIISTVLVYRQMDLFRNKQLGFDKDQVAVIHYYGDLRNKLNQHPELLKNEFLSSPDILAVGESSNIIGDDLSVESVIPVNPIPGKEYPTVRVFRVDENYLKVLNIPLKEGRYFSRAFHDSAAFILNETAARMLELKNPVGSTVINNSSNNLRGQVVGVVKDFHFASLHNQVEPLVLQYAPSSTSNLLVKIRAGKTASAIAFLKDKIAAISPNALFNYSFLDEKISGLYKKEDNMSTLLKVFSVFSILISCLGLFGLAAYAAEVRTREVGIRKVIGASTTSLVRLLSRDFMIPVVIGNLLSWPFAWWAIHKWLQEFTYKIEIGWWVFALSLILTGLIALLTVGFRCLRTARANPVQSLRSE